MAPLDPTKGFESVISIYCINLAKSEQRRSAIELQAQELGLCLQFIEAIDGASMWRNHRAAALRHYDFEARKKHYCKNLKPTEIACALSHRKALETFLQSKSDHAIIIEDDIAISPNMVPLVTSVAENIGFDIMKLDTPKPSGFQVANMFGFDVCVTPHATRGAMGIAYSRAGASKVLAMTERFHLSFDGSLMPLWRHNIEALAVYPALVEYQDVVSDIGPRSSGSMHWAPWRGVRRAVARNYHSVCKRLYAYRIAGKVRARLLQSATRVEMALPSFWHQIALDTHIMPIRKR